MSLSSKRKFTHKIELDIEGVKVQKQKKSYCGDSEEFPRGYLEMKGGE